MATEPVAPDAAKAAADARAAASKAAADKAKADTDAAQTEVDEVDEDEGDDEADENAQPVENADDDVKVAERKKAAEKSRGLALGRQHKFKSGDYEVLEPITHNGKRYGIGRKVHIAKGAQARQLAEAGAIKVEESQTEKTEKA